MLMALKPESLSSQGALGRGDGLIGARQSLAACLTAGQFLPECLNSVPQHVVRIHDPLPAVQPVSVFPTVLGCQS